MGGICGIIHFDGAPVDPDLLRSMAEASAYRGPDGVRYLIHGNIGFVHLALNTTSESTRERQPLLNRRNDLILVADARVDNRAELIGTLTTEKYIQENDPTDADLILAAYECWGEACPKHIVGDFAFAAWDVRSRRLVCVRDPMGVRPLFYCRRGSMFLFASTLASILAVLDERPELNEALLFDCLCWRHERRAYETPYEGIFQIPMSHVLVAGAERTSFERYWTFGVGEPIRYARSEDYAEHLLALFQEAVRVRLRCRQPVAISVSGGLDSSSIASVAHDCRVKGMDGFQGDVRLYSLLYDERFPKADERKYAESVFVKCRHFPVVRMDGSDAWGFQEIGTEGGYPNEFPEMFPFRSALNGVLRRASEDGCNVVLHGEGGDIVAHSDFYGYPEYLLDVKPHHVLAELGHFWNRNGMLMFRNLSRAAVRQLAPEIVVDFVRQHRGTNGLPPWARVDVFDSYPPMEFPFELAGVEHLDEHAAVRLYRLLHSGGYAGTLNYLNMVGAAQGFEYRFPFLDRRIVDFLLRVPTHAFFFHGLDKGLLRRSLTGVLPEEVRERSFIVHLAELLSYGMHVQERAQMSELLDEAEVALCDHIDVEEFRRAWLAELEGKVKWARVNLVGPIMTLIWLKQNGY